MPGEHVIVTADKRIRITCKVSNFSSFPKPNIANEQDYNTVRCQEWIACLFLSMCPHSQLDLKRVVKILRRVNITSKSVQM